MELTTQVRERLRVRRVGPEKAGDLLTRDGRGPLKTEARDDLLMARRELAPGGFLAGDRPKPAEKLDAHGHRLLRRFDPQHGALLHVGRQIEIAVGTLTHVANALAQTKQ